MNWFLDRFGVRTTRKILSSAAMLFFLAAITILNYWLVRDEFPVTIPGPRPTPPEKTKVGEPTLEEWEKAYRPIWESRWGARKMPEPKIEDRPRPSPPAPAPQPPAPRLSTRFELLGFTTGSRGSVILADRTSGKRVILYVGEYAPDLGASLAAVEEDRASFTTGAETTEELRMPEREYLARGDSRQPALVGSAVPGPASRSPAPVASSSEFVAAWKDDPRSGDLTVDTPIPPLQPGDRLLAMNGRRVASLEQLTKEATGDVRLTLVRGSRTVELALRVGQEE